MTACLTDLELEAFADGEEAYLSQQALEHLSACPSCAARLERIGAANAAFRESAEPRAAAPARLKAWIAEQRHASPTPPTPLAPARQRINRRRLLAGGAAAAAALGGLVLVRPQPLAAAPMAQTLLDDYGRQLADADQLDFTAQSSARLLSWFNARLPFQAPSLPGLERVGVRGGRLCWLLERHFAALHLGGTSATRCCLYITAPQGLTLSNAAPLPETGAPPAEVRGEGFAGLFWRDTLAFGLVGSASDPALADLAETLRQG